MKEFEPILMSLISTLGFVSHGFFFYLTWR